MPKTVKRMLFGLFENPVCFKTSKKSKEDESYGEIEHFTKIISQSRKKIEKWTKKWYIM